MFHNKINRRLKELEIADMSLVQSITEVFSIVGSDINKVRNRISALELYLGIEYSPLKGYQKAKKIKKTK